MPASSDALASKREPRPFTLAPGKSLSDVVGISANDDMHFAWYKDQTVSAGSSDNLSNKRKPRRFALAPGKSLSDVAHISSNDDMHFAWYKDQTVSAGSSDDLSNKRKPRWFELAPGKSLSDDVVGISSNDDMHFAWYKNLTVSAGSSDDLSNKREPYSFRVLWLPFRIQSNTLEFLAVTEEISASSFTIKPPEGADFLTIQMTENGGVPLQPDNFFKVNFTNINAQCGAIGAPGNTGYVFWHIDGTMPDSFKLNLANNARSYPWAIIVMSGKTTTFQEDLKNAVAHQSIFDRAFLNRVFVTGESKKRSVVPGSCLVCQLQWFVVAGLLLLPAASALEVDPETVESIQAMIKKLTVSSTIVTAIARVVGAKESNVINGLKLLAANTSPIEWPGIWCQYWKMCE